MKKHYLAVTLVVALFIFLTSEGFAASKWPLTRETPYILRSVEGLGMGNAFYGKSTGKYALFYNPAALKDVEKWTVDIIPLTLGVNQFGIEKGFAVFRDVLGDTKKLEDANFVKEKLVALMGGYHVIGPVTFFPAFTMKNFSVGIFSTNDVTLLAFNKEVMPEAAFSIKSDNGIAAAYAMQFFDDSLSVGISLKGLYRINFTKSYTALEIAGLIAKNSPTMEALKKEIQNEGMGWGILGTVGVIYDVPSFGIKTLDVLKPRAALSFNDFGYTKFGSLMDKIDPTLNLSLSIAPSWKFISSYIAIEFNDLLFMAGSDKSFGKRFNLGAEVGFWDHIFLRGGFHQGYVTAGVGFDLWFVRINGAYYTEELGAYPGQYPDERYALEFVIGI